MSASTMFPLFGGAAQILLPSTFEDMSDFRPVPDHQEFLYDKTTEQVAIIELLERKDDVADPEAAKWFLEDVVVGELDLRQYQFEGGRQIESAEMPHFDSAVPKSMATATFRQTWQPGQNPSPVRVQLASLRLVQHNTDLLIALYDPIQPSSTEGSVAPLPDVDGRGVQASEIFQRALQSFELVNPSILGGPPEVEMGSDVPM